MINGLVQGKADSKRFWQSPAHESQHCCQSFAMVMGLLCEFYWTGGLPNSRASFQERQARHLPVDESFWVKTKQVIMRGHSQPLLPMTAFAQSLWTWAYKARSLLYTLACVQVWADIPNYMPVVTMLDYAPAKLRANAVYKLGTFSYLRKYACRLGHSSLHRCSYSDQQHLYRYICLSWQLRMWNFLGEARSRICWSDSLSICCWQWRLYWCPRQQPV